MKFSLLKLSLGICLLLGFSIPLQAQLEDPVDWKFEIKQVGPDEHEIHFKASIEPGWHLYSQYIEPGGPIPTSFNFETVDGIEVLGKAKEVGELHRGFDETFKMDVAYFSDQGTYVQRIKRLKDQASAQGYLEYMVCNDQKCLPPTAEDFSFTFTNSFEEEKTAEAPAPPKAEKSPAPEKKVAAVPEKASQTPQVAEAPAPAEEPLVEIEETTPAPSGILQPVSWDFAYEKIDDETYQLLYTAKIEDGWKVYSQFIEPGGPIPTAFEMEAGAYEVSGEVAEKGNIHKSFDEVFKMDLAYFEDKVVFVQKVKAKDPNTVIKGSLLFMTCNDEKCLPPDYVDFAFNLSDPAQTGKLDLASLEAGTDGNPYKINTIDLDAPAAACTVNERETEGKGLLTIFLLGFGGGLLALLTPCVFPMIPITVGFFTKSAEGGRGLLNAIAYGSFIFLIYTALSIPFHLTESVSSDIFNEISTNMWLNLAFFAIFLIFAISFLGYFEITLPSKFTNRMQSASSVGGMLGIFFLALVLALVSFSCTGPILGTLLVGALSSDGGAMQLTAGLAGFGLALGAPFALLAASPALLKKLPRSGGWMTTLKVVLGHVELALAVKFLSNADLVEHWGLLKREIFFGLWIAISISLLLYIIGKVRFPHDTKLEKINWVRWGTAALLFAWILHLAPGVSNTEYANRNTFGLAPPLFYSIYDKDTECPLGLPCFKDYEEGLAYARKVNKPIMLDFTGWACVNCRKMEENVWENQEIFDRLNDQYVLISLYVDDRKKLEQDEQAVVTLQNGQQKKIRTIGNKWSTLQAETFGVNSQPYYVLMSPDEKLLNNPVGYTPDVTEFQSFLDCGLSAYEQKTTSAGTE